MRDGKADRDNSPDGTCSLDMVSPQAEERVVLSVWGFQEGPTTMLAQPIADMDQPDSRQRERQ